MTIACTGCGAELHEGDAFCESCGAPTAEPVTAPASTEVDSSPMNAATSIATAPRAAAAACVSCGGVVGPDGFCDTCGVKARTWRDHWTEAPAPWIGAVCDRGIRHSRNEDAMAVAASPDAAWAVLVVCDGVTSAPDSDQASLAAATEARDHLVGAVRSFRPTGGAADIESASRWMTAACRVAQVAVVSVTERLRAAAPGGVIAEPPSCTFVATALVGRRLATAWCGDSRAYWLPDARPGVELSTDHSLASELIASGMSRVDAEQDPTAHTITRWLGADSPTPIPDVASRDLDGAGWLLVCSDGMWNYASTPEELAALIADASAAGATTPLAIAESLAAYANDRGGHDNISVCMARVDAPSEHTLPTPDQEA